MYTRILLLVLILFISFCIIWKNELFKSLFYTVWFIIALWINIPCFVNISILESSKNFTMLPFELSDEWGILYTLLANIILGILLFFQAKFSNSLTHNYKQIKKVYDDFGNDAVQLYIIGKDLDFLYKKNFKRQTDRITHLGDKCWLLCQTTKNKELLGLYKRVYKHGVQIKCYTESDNITNIKGQIKIDQNGIKRAIFTSKLNRKYLLLNIENQFLVSTILEQCIKAFNTSPISERGNEKEDGSM